MPLIQQGGNIAGCYPLLRHEHQQMVSQICDFPNGFRIVPVFGGDNGFRALFPHFFQDFIDSLIKKVASIGILRRVVPAVKDRGIHLFYAIVHKGIPLSIKIFHIVLQL